MKVTVDEIIQTLVSCGASQLASAIREHGIARHSCSWTPDDEGVYETQCGHTFVFIDGGCSENNANYCQYCGGKVIERDWEKDNEQ